MVCPFDECCVGDMHVCEAVLGPLWTGEETTPDRESCFIGLPDDNGACDPVCGQGHTPAFDARSIVKLRHPERESYGYLQPQITQPRHRDAHNAIADFGVSRPGDKPGLFTELIWLESSQCPANLEDFAGWGINDGHSCQCYHEPPQDCQGVDTAGTPVEGFMHPRFTYRLNRFPHNTTSLECHKWSDGMSASGADEAPQRSIMVGDDDEGLPQFVGVYRNRGTLKPWHSMNALNYCSATVEPTVGDCGTGMRNENGSPTTNDYAFPNAERGWFEYLLIEDFTPEIPGNEFATSALQAIATIEDEHGRIDALQHRQGADGNQGIGIYTREFVRDVESAPVIGEVEGVTKWGGLSVTAEVVAMSITLRVRCFLAQTSDYNHDTPPTEYITPYFNVEIDVLTGTRATLEGSAVIAGETVSLTEDTGLSGVTPDGNEIIWNQDVPRLIEWRGRLDRHSEPATVDVVIEDDPNSAAGSLCRDIVYTFRDGIEIGGLSDLERTDRNKAYAGNVVVKFRDQV